MATSAFELDLARLQRRRSIIILASLLLAFGALGGKLAYVNTTLAPALTSIVREQQTSRTLVPARRGSLFDARGRLVAGTEMLPTVYVDPTQIERSSNVAAKLAPVLNMPRGEIEALIHDAGHRSYCVLKREVSRVESEAVQGLKLRGVGVADASCRRYPLGRLMSQTIGFCGRDGDGLEGLELGFDGLLAGRDGQRVTIRDARRRIIFDQDKASTDPLDGGHLLLTLDTVVQEIAEAELAKAVKAVKAEFGMTVVMAPKTGDVLAMATYPTFDLADISVSTPEQRRNRVVTDAFEPGSVFKPFVMAGAVAQRAVVRGEWIYCHEGSHYFGKRLVHDTKPCGALTLEGIIARSSNIGMGIVGTRMGNSALYAIVTRFGFGNPTGVGFPGESPGLVAPLDEWNSYTTTSVPMGHEMMVTPLQLATAMCALCNDGVRLKPRVVKALLEPDGTVRELFDQPEIVRRVVPSDVAEWLVQKAMTAVVAESAKSDPLLREYRVAGKTGTAQVPYKDRRGYQPDAYLASFMGVAPADDPQVVALVMIYKPDPSLGYYGRVVSLPAVRSILVGTLRYLQAPIDRSSTSEAGPSVAANEH